MKFLKPQKLELYSFLFSMPIIAATLNLIMFGERLWKDPKVAWISMPLIFIMGMCSWYLHTLYETWAERKYPALNQSRQRIIIKMMVVFLVMSPSVIIIFLTYDYFHILGYTLKKRHLLQGLVVGACVNLIFETLYEADYIFTRYKESTLEKEAMRKLSVSQHFDTLKSQVNPHFLFNCFNTLSSLIAVDKEKADTFLNELSKVYRYLLKNHEESISTVNNEIRFIQSYYKLLQTRHGDAVQLNLQIDRRYDQYWLPSLALQLLVENVVKHNALSKSKPLVIDIFTTAGNKLVVNNNLQRRAVKAPSNGVGIENIKSRYRLLQQAGFQVMEDEKNFTVVLPLIWRPREEALVQ